MKFLASHGIFKISQKEGPTQVFPPLFPFHFALEYLLACCSRLDSCLFKLEKRVV